MPLNHDTIFKLAEQIPNEDKIEFSINVLGLRHSAIRRCFYGHTYAGAVWRLLADKVNQNRWKTEYLKEIFTNAAHRGIVDHTALGMFHANLPGMI